MRNKILAEILEEARQRAQDAAPLNVIFDLDSTLFDVTPRIYKVLHEFAESVATMFPEEARKMLMARLGKKDYGLKTIMTRAGLSDASEEFKEMARTHWLRDFFSNEYLHHDTPYPGAVDYVNELHKAGARIVYLTGRDVERMGEGSFRVLQTNGFPIGVLRTELVLKPEKGMHDPSFKRDVLRDFHSPTWFFENEPENIHLILADCPSVRIVFFDSTHLGKAEAPGHLPTIEDYLR